MCLITRNEIKIADKPILVYKAVSSKKDRKFLWIRSWKACFQKTRHRYDKVLEAVEHLEIINKYEIHRGFHAYMSDVSDVDFPLYVDRRIAIIPQGAEYCIGGVYEIVANKMIVFSSEEKFREYMKKEKE